MSERERSAAAPEAALEAALDAALEAARHHTDAGLEPARAQAVLARVEAQLAAPRKPRLLAPMLGLGFAAAAAVAVLLVLRAPVADAPLEAARIVYRSGEVRAAQAPLADDTTAVAPDGPIALAAATRVDLELPAVARVAVFGPATVARNKGGVALLDGRAAFSVRKHAPGASFVVGAGDLDVVVHGTLFDVVVRQGHLASVDVTEGKVELRPKSGAASTFLTGGMRFGAAAAPGVPTGEVFDAPWWAPAPAVQPAAGGTGYLLVDSTPSGAEVALGGSTIGTTPLIVRWPAGAHAVELTLEGHQRWTASAAIEPGGIARLDARLAPAARAAAEPAEPEPERRTEPRRSPAGDLWAAARKLLDARQCKALDPLVARMVRQSDDPADRARAEMLAAECHLRARNKPVALDRYRQVTASYPETPSAETALYEAAKLQSELGQRSESLGTIDRYLALHPDGHFAEAALFRRCELLVRLESVAPARTCLEDYRERHPSGLRLSQALLLLATIARSEGRWADAAPLYRAYLDRAPEGSNAEVAERRRIECLRWGKLEGVDAAIEDYLRRYPSGAHSEEVRGWMRGR